MCASVRLAVLCAQCVHMLCIVVHPDAEEELPPNVALLDDVVPRHVHLEAVRVSGCVGCM